MIFNKQTRLHTGSLPHERGNCFPTVIACFLNIQPEEALQFQELYDTVWFEPLLNWLEEKGYQFQYFETHPQDTEYYFVTGVSPRDSNVRHICVYKNGKIAFDPHPDNTGILTEEIFERLVPLNHEPNKQ